MSQAEYGWINIFRNFLDVIAAAILVGLVVTFLSVDVSEPAIGPLQDSTLVVPDMFYVQSSAVSVNRTLKSDRVRGVSLARPSSKPLPSIDSAPSFPKKMPVGCDPAFSPVADPAHAHVYKRCIV